MATFRELLQASMKSNDTEEWVDAHFNHPIGLLFALLWNKLNIHPNVITILSFFLGAAAGVMFSYTTWQHNVTGIALLMLANFCDSTDGQMARLTGKKTLLGRVLDGVSGDVWFVAIYIGLSLRLMNEYIPGTHTTWGLWAWVLSVMAGALGHSPQSSLSDYYRQIHLYFLKGKERSELDNYAQQMAVYRKTPRRKWFDRIFYRSYAGYCKSQEKRTPAFQRFFAKWNETASNYSAKQMAPLREEFLKGSRPLMKYTNLLTFNSRAFFIYATCLLGCFTNDVAGPWIYLVFEAVVLNLFYVYMKRCHEQLCMRMTTRLQAFGLQNKTK